MPGTQDCSLVTDYTGKPCYSETIPSQLDTTLGQINTTNANFAYNGTIWKPVQLDATTDRVKVDSLTNLGETDSINAGKSFFATSAGVITLASNSNIYVLFKTGASKNIHLCDVSVNVSKNSASGIVKFEEYEGTTVSANGTDGQVSNCNRQSAITNQALVYTQPTITSLGTKLLTYVVHQDWETYIAPSYTTKFKLILKQSENYLFRINNGYNQSLDVTWFVFWQEL
jgi:hypothetical protein